VLVLGWVTKLFYHTYICKTTLFKNWRQFYFKIDDLPKNLNMTYNYTIIPLSVDAYLIAPPKPSQSSKFSLEGFIISTVRHCLLRRRLQTYLNQGHWSQAPPSKTARDFKFYIKNPGQTQSSRISDVRFQISDFGLFQILDFFRFQILNFRFWILDFRFWTFSYFRFWTLDFRFWTFQISDFVFQISDFWLFQITDFGL